MENKRNNLNIPTEGMDTPKGYLYNPPKQGKQILFLIAAFFTAIFLGFIVSSIPGDLSNFATGVICFVFLMVFFLGYGLWVGLVSALLFSSVKWPLFKIFAKVFIRKERPASLNELLPEREKLIELMLKAQKYSRTFLILSWPIGFAGGLATMFMKTSTNSAYLFVIVMLCVVIYGFTLSYFGRRGYFPFPEE
jgi:hypothetical protein